MTGGYFFFEVKFYDEETYELCSDRGILYADSFNYALEILQGWYGVRALEDVHIWFVQIDTEEILLERNFPGIMNLLSNPIE